MRQLSTRLEEEIKGKETFFASVTHELKNPLHALLCSLEALRGLPDEERADMLANAHNSGQMLQHLIGNILDFSKAQLGHIALTASATDLRYLCEKILKMYKSVAQSKNLALQFCCETAALPPSLKIDGPRFSQVLINLLSNALKFTHAGKVILNVSWHPLGDNDSIPKRIHDLLAFSNWKMRIEMGEETETASRGLQRYESFLHLGVRKKQHEVTTPLDLSFDTSSPIASHEIPVQGIVKIEVMDTGIGINLLVFMLLHSPSSASSSSQV